MRARSFLLASLDRVRRQRSHETGFKVMANTWYPAIKGLLPAKK